jgi:hypothetical protein
MPWAASDLLRVAFCRTKREHAHVSFSHQSMSFKKRPSAEARTAGLPLEIDWLVCVS